MKFQILLITAVLLLNNCDSEETKREIPETKPQKEKVAIIDSTLIEKQNIKVDTTIENEAIEPSHSFAYLMPEELDLLKNYLIESDLVSLDLSLVELTEAKSDTAIIQHFLNLMRVTDLFKDSAASKKGYLDPFEAEEKFAVLPEAILGFKNSCMAECTEYDVSFNMPIFYDISNKTKGVLDNDFFDLIKIMDENTFTTSHNFKNWFGQVWDYGGATLLGDSTHYNFLKKSKELMSKTTITHPFLSRYINECGGDMLHGIYMYSQEEVLSEIELVLSLKMLNEETETRIKKLKTTILSDDYTWENCVGGMLQFNCATGDCDFGG